PLDVTDKKIMQKAKELYAKLEKENIDSLLDDRDERAGVKFKDADLIGISLQLIVGKEFLKKDVLELKVRRGNKKISGTSFAILKEIKRRFLG
ncbi:MAG: His/Gly/Thr/Pro-type tRNA ligase C-terminal domain-containing protein, partial [Candidatus Omnitrophica bacterium]|nr:His/Gly/Thr/Pro-type tRNA ligase C-terminal domain-containing protein [Candidatus Omnitrophota bacterium]